MSEKGYNKLFRETLGYLTSQCIYTVAKMDIADKIGDGVASISELAMQTQSDEDYLYRVMRLLSNQEIFESLPGKKFSNNDASTYLRSDVKHTFKDFAILINAVPCPFPAISKLSECVQSGKVPFEEYYGQPVFNHVAENTELASLLDAAMISAHTRASDTFLKHFSLDGVSTFADIGGGSGEATTRVLKEYPNINAIVFDQPHVIERTAKHFKKNGLENRCSLIGGDFFDSIPVKSDMYFMRQILHDWTHDQCVKILRNLRSSAEMGSRLLISDCVINEKPKYENTPFYDLLMLYITGGRERTVEEFDRLFKETGFDMVDVVDTGFWFGVIEARAA
ncbi:MAG: methyltransferase [Candidatus Thiodiazotropha sp.]